MGFERVFSMKKQTKEAKTWLKSRRLLTLIPQRQGIFINYDLNSKKKNNITMKNYIQPVLHFTTPYSVLLILTLAALI